MKASAHCPSAPSIILQLQTMTHDSHPNSGRLVGPTPPTGTLSSFCPTLIFSRCGGDAGSLADAVLMCSTQNGQNLSRSDRRKAPPLAFIHIPHTNEPMKRKVAGVCDHPKHPEYKPEKNFKNIQHCYNQRRAQKNTQGHNSWSNHIHI